MSASSFPITPRRIVAAVAVGGGALGAFSAMSFGLLAGQAFVARRIIPAAEAPPPRCEGVYGADHPGEPLQVAIIGDSTAAGYGVTHRDETLGALLAGGIAAAAGRPVRLTCPAYVGSFSGGLPPQVETAIEAGVDLAIIIIGANDVTGRVRADLAVGHLSRAVRALRAVGAEVVVGTCPDLGTVKPIQPPLRWLARRWSRQLAAAQTIATIEAGGRTVSLGDLLGPEFAAAPERMFGADRFHPSADGYVAAAAAMLPATLGALGLPGGSPPGTSITAGVRSLPAAAAAAAGQAGAEVRPVEGTAGRFPTRWAHLRLHLPIPGSAGTAETAPGTVVSESGTDRRVE